MKDRLKLLNLGFGKEGMEVERPEDAVRVIYLAVSTVDTIGTAEPICEAFNPNISNDTDESTELQSSVRQMCRQATPYFSEGTLHTSIHGTREMYAFDLVRESRWRITTVVQSSEDGSLSAITDMQDRAKDTLLVLWRDLVRYRSPEYVPALRTFLLQVDGAGPDQRFGDHIRTAPYILSHHGNRKALFVPPEDDQSDPLMHDYHSPLMRSAKRMAMLRFAWCLFLFSCVWICCICAGAVFCLAVILLYSAFS